MPVQEALDCCLYVMHRWGHIKCFRFDNGRPFGTPTLDGVSPCAAVLAALGCKVIFNQPRRPTQNAKVERNQGTTYRWAAIHKCESISKARQALDQAVIDQRENYSTRVCGGKTRLQAYPSLTRNPRRFNSQDFQAKRAYEMIGQYTFARVVSQNGQISLLGRRYQIGMKNAAKKVLVEIIIKMGVPVWVVKDDVNSIINRQIAKPLLDHSFIEHLWPPR